MKDLEYFDVARAETWETAVDDMQVDDDAVAAVMREWCEEHK